MSKSLQEQLLSLGLAQDKPAKQKPSAQSSGGKPGRGSKSSAGGGKGKPGKKSPDKSSEEMALARAYALREREEKKQAELTRRQKQEEDRRRRELNIALKAIVNQHRLNDPKAETARNFMYKGRIRKIHLTPEQLAGVNSGELGVVYLLGGYHLLAAEHVEAARNLSPEHVPDLTGSADDDDEFPVPDDLIW